MQRRQVEALALAKSLPGGCALSLIGNGNCIGRRCSSIRFIKPRSYSLTSRDLLLASDARCVSRLISESSRGIRTTVVDGYSVKVLLLSPILVDFAENLIPHYRVLLRRLARTRSAASGIRALLARSAWNRRTHAFGIHLGVVRHAHCAGQPHRARTRDVDDDRRVFWDEAAA